MSEELFRACVYPAPYLDDTRDNRWIKRSRFKNQGYDVLSWAGAGLPTHAVRARMAKRHVAAHAQRRGPAARRREV